MSKQPDSITEEKDSGTKKKETADPENKKQITSQNVQENENVAVGVLLRRRRHEKGLSIKDVARKTNISPSNLISVEHGDYNELPADTFIRGQILIYANLLDLDGDKISKKFLQERHNRQLRGKEKNKFAQEDDHAKVKKLAEPNHLSSATLAGGMLLMIIVFIALFSLYTGWNPFSYFLDQNEPVQEASSIVPAEHSETVVEEAYVVPETEAVVQSKSDQEQEGTRENRNFTVFE